MKSILKAVGIRDDYIIYEGTPYPRKLCFNLFGLSVILLASAGPERSPFDQAPGEISLTGLGSVVGTTPIYYLPMYISM